MVFAKVLLVSTMFLLEIFMTTASQLAIEPKWYDIQWRCRVANRKLSVCRAKKSGNQQEKKEHADKNETLLAAFNIIHNTERPHEGVLETIRT